MQRRDLEQRLSAGILRPIGILPRAPAGRHIARQVLRGATSTGANVAGAQAAESSAEFAHKLQVALKEARETNYWLRLIDTLPLAF
jgi:four helix bundle protein